MSNFEISSHFFLQLAFILAICRIVGLGARKIRQPQVVAEMVAGALMGPSFFGLFFPELQSRLFPKDSMPILYAVSQMGLVLYMFLVGLEFRSDLIRQRLRSAISVSLAGVLAPLLLGGLLAISLINSPEFFSGGVSTWHKMLFLGAAMSITAFPVLARIIFETGLTGTSLGTLTLAAGSMDDALAWCLLAIVLTSFSGNGALAFSAVGGGVLYAVVILFPGKSLLRRLGTLAERSQGVSGGMLSFTLVLVMLGAWFTDTIRIYAVFGAFILGAAMPRGVFARDVQGFLAPLTTNLLLPLFFVYSGINTRIGLLHSRGLWLVTLLVLLVSCFGKGFACWLAARWNGENRRDAMAIGTLMNARGLMELILLNIGLEKGIITPTLFTIMVLMAIVTTVMTLPVFEWVYKRPEEIVIAGTEAKRGA